MKTKDEGSSLVIMDLATHDREINKEVVNFMVYKKKEKAIHLGV